MDIALKNPNPPTDLATIMEFQQTWGINLPPSYRDFLLAHNGGRPVQNVFPIMGFENPIGAIQIFFGLNTSIETSDLNWQVKTRIAPFPPGLLEIACTGSGDLICIDTKAADAPVYFFDQRPSWGNGVWRDGDLYEVAPSFVDFLSKLKSS